MSSGFKETYSGCLVDPPSHSSAVRVGFQVSLVSGNRSSWKTFVLTLGTVKLMGSMDVSVSRYALANSTSLTEHTFFGRKAKPCSKQIG